MSVIVICKRVFEIKQKDKLIPLLKDLQNHAKKQKGFISRTTFSNLNDPNEYIVISKWKKADHWIQWMNKDKTKKIQGDIDSLIGEKTFFDVYNPEDF